MEANDNVMIISKTKALIFAVGTRLSTYQERGRKTSGA